MHILKPSYPSQTNDTGGGLDGKVRILSETWIELEFASPTTLFQVTVKLAKCSISLYSLSWAK